MTPYQKYQLQWMIDHDHSLDELFDSLERYQIETEHETILGLFDDWVWDTGFGGEIWACLDEWRDCEGSDRK